MKMNIGNCHLKLTQPSQQQCFSQGSRIPFQVLTLQGKRGEICIYICTYVYIYIDMYVYIYIFTWGMKKQSTTWRSICMLTFSCICLKAPTRIWLSDIGGLPHSIQRKSQHDSRQRLTGAPSYRKTLRYFWSVGLWLYGISGSYIIQYWRVYNILRDLTTIQQIFPIWKISDQ